jgi:hypothetical protein
VANISQLFLHRVPPTRGQLHLSAARASHQAFPRH